MPRHPKKYLAQQGIPHVGNMLKAYYKEHRIYQNALARSMKRSKYTLRDFKKRPSLQVALLWEISQALQYNFLRELANQLPPQFPPHAPPPDATELNALKEQVKQLQIENSMLKDLMKGK